MDYSRSIMKVLDSTKKLQKIVASKPLVESSFLIFNFNEWKKISLLNQLQHTKKHLNCFAAGFDNDFSIAIILN